MIGVLRNGTYRALFSAQVLALLGTGLLTVALGLLAFDLAGASAGLVLGTALTIKMVAYVGVAPLAAAVLDRLPKKAVLIGADLVRLSIAIALPFVSETWQIYLLVFGLQAASATFTPAFQSLIPSVLSDPAQYTRALALSRTAYDLEALVSPAIAAALLAFVSYNNLFVGTAIGFAASAVLVAVAAIPPRREQPPADTFWRRVTAGGRVFVRTPSLRFVMASNAVIAAATALVLVNSVVYVKAVLGRDDAALAWTFAAYGLGSLAAALWVPRIVDRVGVTRTMVGGMVAVVAGLVGAVGVAIVLTSTSTGWPALLAIWSLLGIGTSLVATPSSRLLADATTDADRGLVYTAQFALSHACFLVTYPLAGVLGNIGLPLATAMLAGLAVCGAFAARATRHRAAKRGVSWELEPPNASKSA
jgi:MFS family permease